MLTTEIALERISEEATLALGYAIANAFEASGPEAGRGERNVTDALFSIANGIHRLAAAIERREEPHKAQPEEVRREW